MEPSGSKAKRESNSRVLDPPIEPLPDWMPADWDDPPMCAACPHSIYEHMTDPDTGRRTACLYEANIPEKDRCRVFRTYEQQTIW